MCVSFYMKEYEGNSPFCRKWYPPNIDFRQILRYLLRTNIHGNWGNANNWRLKQTSIVYKILINESSFWPNEFYYFQSGHLWANTDDEILAYSR